MIERKKLIRWISLAAYFAAAFLVFLLVLFPFDRVKSRIESEVRARTSLELGIARISPRFFNRFLLTDVVVSDKEGKVLFESPAMKVHLPLFGLLRGLTSVNLSGRAYGGDLSLRTEQGAKRRFLSVDANGLDLGSYTLFKVMGIKLSGKTGGTFEMTNDDGKARLWVKNLASRELKIKGFPVPDLDFEQGWIEADLKGDRLTVKKLDLEGKELKIRVSGDLVLRERGSLNLAFKIKPSERLAKEQALLIAFLKNKDAEGFYQFSLGGTVAEPLPRL
ncbi:MAG: type II secretion system protein GspN [Nitrospiraceae bacterium]|nr:type II secretion system protein GspN [Nitrospiraceae bacterium]